MRKNAMKVIQAFVRGEYLGGQTIHTDGQSIFSYKMEIAHRVQRGPHKGKVALISYDHSPSKTTTTQIHAVATAIADVVQADNYTEAWSPTPKLKPAHRPKPAICTYRSPKSEAIEPRFKLFGGAQ